MNTPYSVKKPVMKKGKQETKTEWVRNADKKKDFIEKFGEEKFHQVALKDPDMWGKFETPELPKRFQWIWLQFLNIWRTCEHDFNGNIVFTPRVVLDYCECFCVSLTLFEKNMLFRMKTWAEDVIYSLKEKDD